MNLLKMFELYFLDEEYEMAADLCSLSGRRIVTYGGFDWTKRITLQSDSHFHQKFNF